MNKKDIHFLGVVGIYEYAAGYNVCRVFEFGQSGPMFWISIVRCGCCFVVGEAVIRLHKCHPCHHHKRAAKYDAQNHQHGDGNTQTD